MKTIDVAVIGAGLLGTFAARELARFSLSVCVLERGKDVCAGISKANSGIVYSGYEVPEGTLKAALCVPENQRFDQLCAELGVRFRRCGSLIVCFGPNGEASIREKYENGRKNGVPGLKLLTREEVLALEPRLNPAVRMGMLSPSTGVVNPWELGIAAYENARANGAEFLFEAEVTGLNKENGKFLIETAAETIRARAVINCAGLSADILRDKLLPPAVCIFTSAADFAVYDRSQRGHIGHVIFHETEDGKGITAVPTIDGNILEEGPGKVKMDGRISVSTGKGLSELYALHRELLPELDGQHIIRHFSAVRPNPFYVVKQADGTCRRLKDDINSFMILDEDGLVSLVGIKTPGLTCARALGALAAEKALAYLGGAPRNASFDPVRTAPVRMHELTEDAANTIIRNDPAYGRIVCRCEEISEGEVRDAIRAGARTLDGVKRRCGTGMGRCQGEFCTGRIAEMLSQERHLPLEQVLEESHD